MYEDNNFQEYILHTHRS